MLAGGNPYDAIGPGREYDWSPLFYPLPSVVAVVPLAPFSEITALTLFALVSGLALAWALSAHGYPSLLLLLTPSVTAAFVTVQWAPLLAGAFAFSPLSTLLVAKPTIGAAVFAAKPTKWGLLGGLALVTVAFLAQPEWVNDWLTALHQGASLVEGRAIPYVPPVSLPAGVILLASLARWRRPEARLLVTLACVPQVQLPYDAVLLLLIPRGWGQCAAMLFCASLVPMMTNALAPTDILTSHASYTWASGRVILALMYLPALAMVLRRPNEGPAPMWLERRLAAWPEWLRGTPVSHVSS
jgi:hypothetical protein